MQNSVFRKALVIGIIVCFVGASIIPGISGDMDGINSRNDIKETEIPSSPLESKSVSPDNIVQNPEATTLSSETSSVQEEVIMDKLASASLFFTENKGQFPEEVLFQTFVSGTTVYLCRDKVVSDFCRENEEESVDVHLRDTKYLDDRKQAKMERTSIAAEFVNANSDVVIVGEEVLPHYNNYFIGNDPDLWYTNVLNYKSVLYKDIYPSIDLHYYGDGDSLKYDFIVYPGGDPSMIEIYYDGVEELELTPNGDMVMQTRLGSICEQIPVIYQEINGITQEISGRYEIRELDSFGFEVDDVYNPLYPLIIDPYLEYSTFLGGSSSENSYDIAVDEIGCVYVTGLTQSPDFPTINAYNDDISSDNRDIFVTKLSALGNSLIYSTYIGGSNIDWANGLAIDSSGCVYIAGSTDSVDYPMVNAYDSSMNGWRDTIVTKLSSAGNSLEFSTYLGGTSADEFDYIHDIAIDNNNCVYVTGVTSSSNFPMVNAYDSSYNGGSAGGSHDAFVTKFSSTGNSLVYSTYIGGSSSVSIGGGNNGMGIAVDNDNCAYVSGLTSCSDFPTVNAYDSSHNGGSDAFVTKFSSTGNSLVYSTYLGGSSSDRGSGIAVDNDNCAYITGRTSSSDYPTVNAYDSSFNGGLMWDAFVTKFSSTGNSLVYSTYLGGGEGYLGEDVGADICVDDNGCAYITGRTDSTDFPIIDPYDDSFNGGNSDAFFSILPNSGNPLICSSYIGGSSSDSGFAIAVDNLGRVYVSGHTQSSNFPIVNAYDSTLSGSDAFITKISFAYYPPFADPGGPYYSNPGYAVNFDGSDSFDNDEQGNSIDAYDWRFFDGDTWHNDIGEYPTHNYLTEGEYTVSLCVWDDEGENDTATDTVYINSLPHPPTADLRAGEPYIGMEKDDPIQFNATFSHDNDEDGESIERYDWKFFKNDIWNNDLGPTPTKIYSDPGKYTIAVRVHDDEGITDNDESIVIISPYEYPIAKPNGPYNGMEDTQFDFDASNSYDPDEYHIDSDGYYIDSYRWDFNNDGSWDTSWLDFSGPYYYFTYFYEYYGSAKLEVKDDEGNTSTSTTSVSVEGYKDPTSDPNGPYYGIVNVPITLHGTGSHDNDQNGDSITQYKWKYYDGDTWHNDGPTPTHTYTSTGRTHIVTLNVTDNDPSGYTGYDESTTTITVENYQDPTADAGGPYNGMSYNPITFDASASYDNDENGCCIEGYRWDWTNDGTWDTEWLTNPVTSHIYLVGFTGSVRVQVKDDDPGGNEGYDIDTASITIIGQPPTADFSISSTNNPLVFNFDASSSIDPRPGFDYHDLTYKWDFNNDGTWDKTGDYSSAGKPTWSYLTSGTKTIKLEVENVDGTDTCSNSVYAFNYDDIVVVGSNKNNFFLGYQDWVADDNSLFNSYSFSTPSGVFDKVSFKLGSNSVVWDYSPSGSGIDVWNAAVKMNVGKSGDKVIVRCYKNDQQMWSTQVDVDILEIPGWFQVFLLNCDVSVDQDGANSYWAMEVTLDEDLGIEFPEKSVPLKLIGGKYKTKATINYLSDTFTIDDSGTLSYPLIQASIPTKDAKLGSYKSVTITGGFYFSASATLELTRSQSIRLVGTLTLGGQIEVKFKFPFGGIPFIAEVGVTGGMHTAADVGMEFTCTAGDGKTFSPTGSITIHVEIGGHAGMYLEVLCGLASFEGGLEAEGNFWLELPGLSNRLKLYGGAYAKASAVWGLWSNKWSYGITWDSGWHSTTGSRGFDDAFLMNDPSKMRCITTGSIDLPALKNYPVDPLKRTRGTSVLSPNVGESAVPKIVLTGNGEGIAVWSDINQSGDGFQSDIFWSVFDGSSWGSIENTSTSGRCEFDPEITLFKEGVEEYVVLTYLAVDKIINITTDSSTFYAGPRIHTAIWNKDSGWSFAGENLIISGGTVNSRCLSSDDDGNIFMCYLKDTDCDPWETGIGDVYVVNGTISGDEVDWDNPVLVEMFDEIENNLNPQISFIDDLIGAVVYTLHNGTNGLNETMILPTVSGINGFADAVLLNCTNLSISYVSSVVENDDIVVFWVENHSRICQTIVDTDPVIGNWVVGDTEVIYENMSVISLKPVSFGEKQYLLFQRDMGYVPFILEELSGDVWGNLRQVSLDERFSLGQVDGDSNGLSSQMIYLRDTSLGDWLVGRWRCNEGENTSLLDDSGLGNNGTLVGDVIWVDQANNSLDSIYGPSLWFNDTNSYVEVPYDSSLVVSDEFTVTCWMNLSDDTGNTDILGVNGSWRIYQEDGNLGIKLWRSNGQTDQTGIATLPMDTWTFIGVTYYNGMLQVIVRPNGYGNTSTSFDLGVYSILDSGNPLILGGFVGGLDDVWLFSRDISMSEVDSIWFTPYPTLGSLHDVVVQPLPSFASFSFGVRGRSDGNFTTEDAVDFVGSPSGLSFEWDFGDGNTDTGETVSHQYDTAGIYTVVCNATDPSTGAVTPVMQMLTVLDATSPVFNGLSSIVGGDLNATLSWDAAVDTAPFVMYYGFMRNETGSFNFSSPCFVTDDTSHVVEYLDADKTYYFVVRAVDAAGNSDSNSVVMSTTPVDSSPPVFEGLGNLYVVDNYPGTVLLEWNVSIDPSTPIMYNVYMSDTSGGQDFNNPDNSTSLTWILISGLDLLNESYYFVVRSEDVWGNEDYNMVELNITASALLSVDISLKTGWNLITVPVDNIMMASGLAENITGSIMISRFDAENQTYRTYIVGGPPGFDFPVVDGYGYFVLVDEESMLSLSGYRIDSVSVPLEVGWNMIGWYHSSDTTASSLSENITGSIMVSWFDPISQSFKTYIVGGPPGFDFTISPGMGLFVLVDESSVWHGEG